MSALTISDIMTRWKCDRDTIYKLISSGKLKAFRVGRDYRVTESVVERYENGEADDE